MLRLAVALKWWSLDNMHSKKSPFSAAAAARTTVTTWTWTKRPLAETTAPHIRQGFPLLASLGEPWWAQWPQFPAHSDVEPCLVVCCCYHCSQSASRFDSDLFNMICCVTAAYFMSAASYFLTLLGQFWVVVFFFFLHQCLPQLLCLSVPLVSLSQTRLFCATSAYHFG